MVLKAKAIPACATQRLKDKYYRKTYWYKIKMNVLTHEVALYKLSMKSNIYKIVIFITEFSSQVR